MATVGLIDWNLLLYYELFFDKNKLTDGLYSCELQSRRLWRAIYKKCMLDRPVILLVSVPPTSATTMLSCIALRCTHGAICARSLECEHSDSASLDYVAFGLNRSGEVQMLDGLTAKREITARAISLLLVDHQGLEPWTDRL